MHGNRRHIHRTKKEQIVTISAHLRPSVIARVIGISPRTVHRILNLWERTGDVVRTPTRSFLEPFDHTGAGSTAKMPSLLHRSIYSGE